MPNLSRKLGTATCALALGLEACAPTVPEPRKPEVVVINIPSVTTLEEVNPEEGQTHMIESSQIQEDSRLTVEKIMANPPARSANEIDAEIQSYASSWSPGKKQRAHVVSQCYASAPVLECMSLQQKENERAIREKKELNLTQCDNVPTKSEEWVECVNEKLDRDIRVRSVRAYCNQLILHCVQGRLTR